MLIFNCMSPLALRCCTSPCELVAHFRSDTFLSLKVNQSIILYRFKCLHGWQVRHNKYRPFDTLLDMINTQALGKIRDTASGVMLCKLMLIIGRHLAIQNVVSFSFVGEIQFFINFYLLRATRSAALESIQDECEANNTNTKEDYF